MAEPRVFISSTYGDLHETRERISEFIINYGYKPVSFEKNDIPYEPHKTLEESCYEEVKECSMFVLLIKSKFGQPSTIKSIKGIKLPNEVKSVTQLEYLFARKLGIPIFVFVHKSSLDEYYTYEKSSFREGFCFNFLESKNHADFIRELFNDKAIRYINGFNSSTEITDILKKQWAGLFNIYLTKLPQYKANDDLEIYINPFKFFFFRRNFGISQNELVDSTDHADPPIR